MNTPTQQDAQLVQQAILIANRAVVEDLETYAAPVRLDGQLWHDTRPMLDPREHCPTSIDMAVQALQYAEASGLVTRHDDHRHLVRVLDAHPGAEG